VPHEGRRPLRCPVDRRRADTVYGAPLNVVRTVRQYEDAGCCGIQLEAQEFFRRALRPPARQAGRSTRVFDQKRLRGPRRRAKPTTTCSSVAKRIRRTAPPRARRRHRSQTGIPQSGDGDKIIFVEGRADQASTIIESDAREGVEETPPVCSTWYLTLGGQDPGWILGIDSRMGVCESHHPP